MIKKKPFGEFLKVNHFQDPYLNECDIKTTNAKSVTDASSRVMFISKNSDSLVKAEHGLFNSPIIIHR